MRTPIYIDGRIAADATDVSGPQPESALTLGLALNDKLQEANDKSF